MKLFLDTNILVDLYEQRMPFYDEVKKLQIMQVLGDAELWVSAKSFTDVYYVMKRRYASEAILQAFSVSFDFLNVCSIDGSDVKQAVAMQWVDFEDCLIDIAAQKVKADALITRDESGFSQAATKVWHPAAFFTYLEQEQGLVYDEIDWWE